MEESGESCAVVAARRITDEYSVVMLTGLWRFFQMLTFSAVWDGIERAVNSWDGQAYTSIRFVHLTLAVLAD
jgi:hypothetical protein